MMPDISKLTDAEIEDIVRSEMVEDDVKRVMQEVIRAASAILFLLSPVILHFFLFMLRRLLKKANSYWAMECQSAFHSARKEPVCEL